jgi:hypothetical protein
MLWDDCLMIRPIRANFMRIQEKNGAAQSQAARAAPALGRPFAAPVEAGVP